ncbi:cytochrome c oxidase assembly protein [Sphingomonas flavalba]|uniref:cytochrome c oxidase assembly protein n=1 Tax=Sphingomonas flavalba TaxID=2559804 RepID=UPI00109E2A7E|nr:cytochrome c oxidase assembly protein [Sphingomonas flavalba]
MTDLTVRNRRSAIAAAVLVVGMLGLGYASVPLYRLFCQVTGFQGTTQRAAAAPATSAVSTRMVRVRFDSNTAPNLPWEFKPERETDDIAIGARDMAFFVARNTSSHEVTGTATFNVSPSTAGKYFTKIQCFCFTQQTLKPGETVRMPVIFFVDPKILDDRDADDIQEITLSYTFFPVDPAKAGS